MDPELIAGTKVLHSVAYDQREQDALPSSVSPHV